MTLGNTLEVTSFARPDTSLKIKLTNEIVSFVRYNSLDDIWFKPVNEDKSIHLDDIGFEPDNEDKSIQPVERSCLFFLLARDLTKQCGWCNRNCDGVI